MAKGKKWGAEVIKPLRGGVTTKRAHDLSPRTQAERAASNASEEAAGGLVPPLTAKDAIPLAALPAFYGRWVDGVLPGGIPREGHATCDNCAMQDDGSKRGADALYFLPETKCCTLVPNLPNYLVGRILLDEDEHPAAVEGRKTVLARIASRGAVTPLGLGRTLAYSLHYRHSAEKFGRSKALRCPHYIEDGGFCGVWKFRESTCATWFCKYERGVTAVRLWSALQAMLQHVEQELSFWAVRELGLDNEAVRNVHRTGATDLGQKKGTFAGHLLSGLGGARHPLGARGASEHEALWGAWVGREVDLYQRSAELVSPLEWPEVEKIAGAGLVPLLARVKAQHTLLLSEELAPRLSSRNDELGLVQIGKKFVHVDSYRAHDPHEVPAALLELLPRFDGRSTEEALALIEREDGVRLDPSLVRKLVDFGLLVER